LRIKGLIWLEDIVEKILTKHRVFQSEIREVLENRPKFRFVEKGHRTDENVYSASGRTDAGRFLIIFFVHKKDMQALILSARDMTPTDRRRYEKK
jgi:uncharacterized DUF497 family protein